MRAQLGTARNHKDSSDEEDEYPGHGAPSV